MYDEIFGKNNKRFPAIVWYNRSSPPEVFLWEGVLKICSTFAGEHPCRNVISIKLKSHFGMDVLLQICCIFSEHLFLRTPLEGCFWYNHRTIIRTGITCKKIPCYMLDSACMWPIVENVKIFRSYVKYFWIFRNKRNCRLLIGLCQ